MDDTNSNGSHKLARIPREVLAWAIAIGGLGVFAAFIAIAKLGILTTTDTPRYKLLAENLLNHNTLSSCATPPLLPEFERMPGYPAFIALVQSVCGNNEVWVVNTQALFHGLGSFLIVVVAWTIAPSRRFAFLAGIGWALLPYQLHFVRALMSESITAETTLIAFGSLIVWIQSGRHSWLVLALGGLSIATYFRPNIFAISPFLLLVAASRPRLRRGRTLTALALGCLVVVVVQTPWAIRNHQQFDRWLVGSHNYIGANLCESFTEFQMSSTALSTFCFGDNAGADWLNECDFRENLKHDERFKERAFSYLKSHPGEFASWLPYRPFRVWFSWENEEDSSTVRLWFMRIGTLLMMIPFLLGSVWLYRQTSLGWISSSICLFISLSHLVLLVSARYSMPGRSFYVISIAYAVAAVSLNGRAILGRRWSKMEWPGVKPADLEA